MRRLGLALVLAAALPILAAAQVYHWVDDQGVIHYTTGIESVPARYRAAARAVGAAGPEGGAEDPAALPRVAGTATRIPFVPGAPIVVSARVNDGGFVELVLDTGAERTLMAPAALARLGIDTPKTYEVTIQGVTGVSRADVVWVRSLEVGGARVGPLAVIAHDADLGGADGLLGRDFLSLFSVTIDPAASVVTLEPH